MADIYLISITRVHKTFKWNEIKIK